MSDKFLNGGNLFTTPLIEYLEKYNFLKIANVNSSVKSIIQLSHWHFFADVKLFELERLYVLHENKSRKKINPKNFLQNAKQEFPCQSLESFSGEYYNMENKILDFQFEPVCAKQTCPNDSVGSDQDDKQKSGMTRIHKNGATVKNMKGCQPVKNACAVTKFGQLRHFI